MKKQTLEICEAFQKTPHAQTIAKQFGCSVQKIWYHLKKKGLIGKGIKWHRMNACLKNKDVVLKLALKGKSLSHIGRTVGTKGSCVHRFLKEHLPDWKLNRDTNGSRNNHWKGGKRVEDGGYILIKNRRHPYSDSHGYVREHRLIMEARLGRYLKPNEVVHHKNGKRGDNRIENLQLFSSNGKHLKHELKGNCPQWSAAGLARMKEGIAHSANTRRKHNPRLLTPNDVQMP